MMTRRGRILARLRRLTAGVLCAALAGCQGEATGDNANATEDIHPIQKTAEVGPVRMTVTADRNRITIAERLKLSIEVFAPEGIDVELGEPGDRLNEFRICDFANRPNEPAEGGRRWTRSYDLDIFLSGEYSIPAMEARFVDRREEAPDRPGEGLREGSIRTEPFSIEVTSLLEGEFDPTAFRDIKGPVVLPTESSRRWVTWVVAGVVAVAAAVLVVTWWRRRRARPEQVIPIDPSEWAFDQLRALIDEQLVEQGQVHEFYFRLSHIVRMYIELRFGLMAPERTTEEFLVEARRSDVLPSEHKASLGDFLGACDRVKFALYEPVATEIETAFDSARDFIQQTAARRDRGRIEQAREVAA
jgi:hypothetical protein